MKISIIILPANDKPRRKKDIFLGIKRMSGYVVPCEFEEGEGYYDSQEGDLSYGLMYHGITYADEAVLPEDEER